MRAICVPMLLLAGCGGTDPLVFDLQSQVAWVQRADAEPRLLGVADRAARFWGAEGVGALDGWVVAVRDGGIDCGDTAVVGCTYFWPVRAVVVSALAGEGWHPRCAEQTELAHEVGHAILYDYHHTDPRWSILPAWQLTDAADHPDCL